MIGNGETFINFLIFYWNINILVSKQVLINRSIIFKTVKNNAFWLISENIKVKWALLRFLKLKIFNLTLNPLFRKILRFAFDILKGNIWLVNVLSVNILKVKIPQTLSQINWHIVFKHSFVNEFVDKWKIFNIQSNLNIDESCSTGGVKRLLSF